MLPTYCLFSFFFHSPSTELIPNLVPFSSLLSFLSPSLSFHFPFSHSHFFTPSLPGTHHWEHKHRSLVHSLHSISSPLLFLLTFFSPCLSSLVRRQAYPYPFSLFFLFLTRSIPILFFLIFTFFFFPHSPLPYLTYPSHQPRATAQDATSSARMLRLLQRPLHHPPSLSKPL